MNTRFFNMARTAPQLSAYFLLKLGCGISLTFDACLDPDHQGLQNFIRTLIAIRLLLASAKMIPQNYNDFQHAKKLLQKQGYQRRWTKHFLDSTCGRQQLKLACKEENAFPAYRQHIQDENIKWHHIDRSKALTFAFPLEGLGAIGAVFWSRTQLNQIEKNAEDQQNKKHRL